MMVDARSLDRDIEADVCIVGSGPAGITLARSLAGRGRRICLVEAGGVRRSDAPASFTDGKNIGQRYFPLTETRVAALGGTSHFWPPGETLRSRPLDPIDFEARPGVPESGWPFPYEQLARYYETAQEACGLPADLIDVDPSISDPMEGVDTVHFSFSAFDDPFIRQLGDLEEADDVTVVSHAPVVALSRGDEPRVTTASIRTTTGVTRSVTARLFVVAGGGLENPRLLLTSRDLTPGGLGNQHDLVGRYFQEHLRARSGVWIPDDGEVIDRLARFSKFGGPEARRIAALALTADTVRSNGLLNTAIYLEPADPLTTSDAYRSLYVVASGLRRPLERGDDPILPHLASLIRRPLSAGRAVAARFGSRREDQVIALTFQAEQAPNPESRVRLTDRTDDVGRQMLALDWRTTELDSRSIRSTQEILADRLASARLGTLEQMWGDEHPPIAVRGSWHHIGTTRMHPSPRKGVVDPDGLVHGTDNVYVAGSSVFPTGGYANPTLTIVALALRLGDHLATRMGGA